MRRAAVPVEHIEHSILVLRGQRVMLDADLAALYGIPTGRFNEAVRRNLSRFPADFMFRLTNQELAALRSQIATSNPGRGGRRYLPYAFTEHGAMRELMSPPEPTRRPIGFVSPQEKKRGWIAHAIRGWNVLLDERVAFLYRIETYRINE